MSNLKILRAHKGMSQRELAEVSGVSIRMIQYYEQGKNDINKAEALTIYKLANALHVGMDKLLEVDEVL